MNTVSRRSFCAIVAGVCLVGPAMRPVGLQAQAPSGTTRLTGTVLDPDGKAVADASVVVRNEATGLVRTMTSDAGGRFSADALPAATYVIEVSAPGFATARRAGLRLAADTSEEVSFTLAIAVFTEQITVSEVASAAARIARRRLRQVQRHPL